MDNALKCVKYLFIGHEKNALIQIEFEDRQDRYMNGIIEIKTKPQAVKVRNVLRVEVTFSCRVYSDTRK